MVEQGFLQVVSIRVPGADVGVVEFEHAKAGVTSKHGIVGFDLDRSTAQAFFSQFGNGAGPAELVAAVSRSLLVFVVRIQWLGKLNEDVTTVTAIGGVFGTITA